MAFIDGNSWDAARAKFFIYNQMIESTFWRRDGDLVDRIGLDAPREVTHVRSDGLYFLRDHIMNLTGDRIWGLEFTLQPTGKFDIKYDYTKPEGYKETDEVITGEEINRTSQINHGQWLSAGPGRAKRPAGPQAEPVKSSGWWAKWFGR